MLVLDVEVLRDFFGDVGKERAAPESLLAATERIVLGRTSDEGEGSDDQQTDESSHEQILHANGMHRIIV
jgi:hypothetical protein